jgi:SurA N-terminal domain
VTIVIRRPVAVSALLAAAGLLLTGCGSGPSQVGAALIIGDNVISVNQVQQELDNVVATQASAKQAEQQGKLDATMRTILTGHVLHQLVGKAAARDGITVSDQEVDQLVSQTGGLDKVASTLSVDTSNARDAVKDVLLEAALADRYADSLAVKFDYVVATTRADAVAKANQLAADPGAIKAMVQAASANGGAGQTGVSISLGQFLQQPQGNLGPLFAAPRNTVVAFQPQPSQSPEWIVAVITDHVGTASRSASSSASSANIGSLEGIGVALLSQEAKSTDVRVSPRYGTWDPVGMQVVAANDQTTGVDVPLHGNRS